MVRCDRSISLRRRTRTISDQTRTKAIDDVIEGYDALMHALAATHAPEFLEIAVTMPQAKVLYLLGVSGELHMSELVARLGVSLSTVSGLVDRVVDHGLATRREDPLDRRHVLVDLTPAGRLFIDRFRELNARQVRQLLELLDDAELGQVRAGLDVLSRAATRLDATNASAEPRAPTPHLDSLPAAHPATRKDPA